MKIPAIAISLLAITLTASAQIERKTETLKTDSAKTEVATVKADKQSRKELMKDLDLTREQRSKMKEIMQANKAAKDAIDNNSQLSEQEKKKQLRELKKDQAQKIQAILTPEQREKFKANRQDNQ